MNSIVEYLTEKREYDRNTNNVDESFKKLAEIVENGTNEFITGKQHTYNTK